MPQEATTAEEREEEGSGDKSFSIEAYLSGDNFEIKKSLTLNNPEPETEPARDRKAKPFRFYLGPP